MFDAKSDVRKSPLIERKQRLQKLLTNAIDDTRLRYVEHFENDGDAVLRSACLLSLEGIVSKRRGAAYLSGRTDNWIKSKCRNGHEVVVGGYAVTDGKFRSLLVGLYRNRKLVYVGRVGTGFSATTVSRLLPRLKSLTTSESPFVGTITPRKNVEVLWLYPELVAEIEFAGWTTDGLLREAAFKGLREDKPKTEVTIEGPTTTPVSRGKGMATIMDVQISNPEKPLWPDGGDRTPITKKELAEYYQAVGNWMIKHIKGRPCSIVRAPNGIDAEQFFQRHVTSAASELLGRVKIDGDKPAYLKVDQIEGLFEVAQLGGVELHPWNCALEQPEVPGRLVFDLDPGPDVPFSAVVSAAREVRERLKNVGLISFCKTTGGNGLHVVSPLLNDSSNPASWDEAKAFARTLCQYMADEHPKLYLTTMAKNQRRGRIFLDYLRNDRMATAVAPLSPRARPHAPVSMPLTWSQVRADLDPKRFAVRTAARLRVLFIASCFVWFVRRLGLALTASPVILLA